MWSSLLTDNEFFLQSRVFTKYITEKFVMLIYIFLNSLHNKQSYNTFFIPSLERDMPSLTLVH